MAQKRHPLGGGAPKIDVVASVDARVQETDRAQRLGRIVHSRVQASQRQQPPEHIPASIAAGDPVVPSDREIHVPPSLHNSSAIWQPEAPEPSTRTAPAGS